MKKIAFVFPGQGSQSVGMLDAWLNHPIVCETIQEASDVLHTDLGHLISQGPKEALDLTVNTQPAMLTTTIACYRIWLAEGGQPPVLLAGHSLGEYAALVAAGVIAFKDAVPLVRFRAEVMQQAVPLGLGAMAAILGLSQEDVYAICSEASEFGVVEAVNFNAPLQIVIAGHKDAVEKAISLAKEQGAKRALLLPVSAPFHSSLLKEASNQLRDYLKEVPFSVPTIPYINNVDVALLSQCDNIKEALARQAAHPVRWVETIETMASIHQVTHVVECGPGKVLAGLTKRIAPQLVSDSFFDPTSLQRVSCMINEPI